jgi:hypothetical protein
MKLKVSQEAIEALKGVLKKKNNDVAKVVRISMAGFG